MRKITLIVLLLMIVMLVGCEDYRVYKSDKGFILKTGDICNSEEYYLNGVHYEANDKKLVSNSYYKIGERIPEDKVYVIGIKE